ncbi:MAG: hypothetical protein ACRCYX_01455 [Dermatophilaceae bacterium]
MSVLQATPTARTSHLQNRDSVHELVRYIDYKADINEIGPLLLIGAAALALIAVMGSVAAACKYMCSPKTVKTCSMKYFPAPEMKVSCR